MHSTMLSGSCRVLKLSHLYIWFDVLLLRPENLAPLYHPPSATQLLCIICLLFCKKQALFPCTSQLWIVLSLRLASVKYFNTRFMVDKSTQDTGHHQWSLSEQLEFAWSNQSNLHLLQRLFSPTIFKINLQAVWLFTIYATQMWNVTCIKHWNEFSELVWNHALMLQLLKELYCPSVLPYINISCKPLIQRGIVLS
jgi:hypothetical protein